MNKNKVKTLSIMLLASSCFVGCSAVFPYHNDFACKGGSNINYCMSLSDMYEQVNSKTNESENAPKKSKKTNMANTNLELENHKLKVMVKSLEAERLKSERKAILLEGDYINENK